MERETSAVHEQIGSVPGPVDASWAPSVTIGPIGHKPHPCAPHRPAKIKATKIPWEAVRKRYVMGISWAVDAPRNGREWPSLAEVAKEFGASLGRVEVVSARDQWPEQRAAFQQRLRAEEDRLLLKRLASKRVRARYAAFMLAGQILELVYDHLQHGGLCPGELARLAKAARISQEISEVAIGGVVGKSVKSVESWAHVDYFWP